MRISGFLFQLSFLAVRSNYYAGRYFDPKNLTHAECTSKQQFYTYYGAKNEALNGRKCVNWETVRNELEQQMKGYYQYYFPAEYEEHNQCRTVLLDQYERDFKVNNASAHSFVHFEEWRKGPWCYVKNLPNEKPVQLWFGKFKSNYRPWPCFEYCAEQKDPPTTTIKPTTKAPAHSFYYNYNEDLIERLSDHFFNNFNFGNAKYPTKVKRRDKLSIGFQVRRHYIFFTFLSILLLAISISIGSYIWHRCKRRRTVVEQTVTAPETGTTTVQEMGATGATVQETDVTTATLQETAATVDQTVTQPEKMITEEIDVPNTKH